MTSYALILPYPPSNNNYKGITKPRISKRTGKPVKRFFVRPEAEIFHTEVAMRFRLQHGIKLLSEKIKVTIEIYPPSNKRGRSADIDNVPKVLLDALEKAGAFKNDCFVKSLYIDIKEKVFDGKLLVNISEIKG